MRIALDTNAYVAVARGTGPAVELVRTATEILLPLVVLGELRAGFAAGTRSERNEASLAAFLRSPRVQVLCPDEQTTFHYARLFAYLRKKGTPVPTSDLWIAALVVQHELSLVTRDAHFDKLPQVLRG